MNTLKIFPILAITLATLLSLNSCGKDNLGNCEEQTAIVCNEDPTLINIRIRNNTEYDFCKVILNPGRAVAPYGTIRAGETTCYMAFDLAYRYAYIQFFAGGKEFVLQPVDYVGEQPLSIGNHTYVVDIPNFDWSTPTIEVE